MQPITPWPHQVTQLIIRNITEDLRPLNSTDFMPFDFYLQGSLTDEVYRTNPHTLCELKTILRKKYQEFYQHNRNMWTTVCSHVATHNSEHKVDIFNASSKTMCFKAEFFVQCLQWPGVQKESHSCPEQSSALSSPNTKQQPSTTIYKMAYLKHFISKISVNKLIILISTLN